MQNEIQGDRKMTTKRYKGTINKQKWKLSLTNTFTEMENNYRVTKWPQSDEKNHEERENNHKG